MEEKNKRKKRSHGDGSIVTVSRNGKDYYKGCVVIGIATDGKAIRKHFGSYKKSVIIEKMRNTKYEADKNLSLEKGDLTFGESFLSWIYNFKKVEVSNNTFAEYETCYRLRIEPYSIAKTKLGDITLQILQRYFNELQKTWNANVIKKTYIKVNSCFNFSLIQSMVHKNFCKGVVIQKYQSKKEEQYKVFTKEEQDRIISQIDLSDVVDNLIYFTFYTGLRLGEVLAVKWEDIEGNTLKIRRQYQKNIEIENGKRKLSYVFKGLKTAKSRREIYLPNKVLKALEHLEKSGDLIFNNGGDAPLDVKKPPRRLALICKKLNIPHRSFHSIRHSYATRLFELDTSIKTVQSLLGHSEIATTMDIYTHVMEEKKIEAAEKLEIL